MIKIISKDTNLEELITIIRSEKQTTLISSLLTVCHVIQRELDKKQDKPVQ
jgi:hypothetical protein